MYKCKSCESYFPAEIHCQGGVCWECIPRASICIEQEIQKSCEMLNWSVIDVKSIFVCILQNYDSANILKCISGGFGNVSIQERNKKSSMKEIIIQCETEEYAYNLLLKIKHMNRKNLIGCGYKYNKYCRQFILRGKCNKQKCIKLHQFVRDRKATLASFEDEQISTTAIIEGINIRHTTYENTSLYTSLITKPKKDTKLQYQWQQRADTRWIYPIAFDINN